MKVKNRFSIFFWILCLAFIFPRTAASWGGFVHPRIAEDAYTVIEDVKFPEGVHYSHSVLWRGVLIPYTREPDNYNKTINHLSAAECAYKLSSFAKGCINAIQNNENWEKIMQDLGRATHFIQDMNCPHHGIQKYIPGDHEAFEKRAVYGPWRKEDFDGFQLIVDLDEFVYNAARFSKRFYKFDNDELFYKDQEFHLKVMKPLWHHTVNDVIDLWLTVFYLGLGEQKYNELGFPQKLGLRDAEKINFPDVDLSKD